MNLEEIKEDFKNNKLNFKTKEDVENVYMTVHNEMQNLEKDFVEKTKDDKSLQEYFKNDNPAYRYTDISFAEGVLSGIDLRNLQRENNNLDGEIESYPYSDEQINIIDKHNELSNMLDNIDYQVSIGAYDFQLDENEDSEEDEL